MYKESVNIEETTHVDKKKRRCKDSPDSVIVSSCSSDDVSFEVVSIDENEIKIQVSPFGAKIFSLDAVTELDPVIAVSIHPDHMKQGLEIANAMPVVDQPAFPNWFPVGTAYPLSGEILLDIFMEYAARATNGELYDHFLIAPNNYVESTRIIGCFTLMNVDPFFQAIAHHGGGHIARVFSCKEASRNLTGEAVNIMFFGGGAVTQAFL